jgi:hypothetical protein
MKKREETKQQEDKEDRTTRLTQNGRLGKRKYE